MRKGFKRYDSIVLGLFGCLVLILPLLRIVQAQHIDIFTLDKFAQKEKPPEAPETGSVKVEDYYSYEVPVEKDKIDKGEILRTDIDLVEFTNEKDKAAYQWHQVEVFDEKAVTQEHTRIVGKLKCTRKRKGVIYWAPDGVKYVIWETWSSWDCAKGE